MVHEWVCWDNDGKKEIQKTKNTCLLLALNWDLLILYA